MNKNTIATLFLVFVLVLAGIPLAGFAPYVEAQPQGEQTAQFNGEQTVQSQTEQTIQLEEDNGKPGSPEHEQPASDSPDQGSQDPLLDSYTEEEDSEVLADSDLLDIMVADALLDEETGLSVDTITPLEDDIAPLVSTQSSFEFECNGVMYMADSEDSTHFAFVSGWGAAGEQPTLKIPATVSDGANVYTVVAIGPYAFMASSFLTLDLSSAHNLLRIFHNAFIMSKLQEVRFPSSGSLDIDEAAFQTCTSLASLTIPASVTSIGTRAFSGCSELASLDLSGAAQLTEIGNNAFDRNSKLSNLIIPANITSIGNGAFSYCGALTSIDFSDASGLRSIGDNAFAYDYLLDDELALPANLTKIGARAFYGTSISGTLTLPSGLTSIGANAFELTDISGPLVLPPRLVSIGSKAFFNTKISGTLSLPSSVTTIGDNAFTYCSSLTSLEFAPSVDGLSIGAGAFIGTGISGDLVLPSGLTSIGNSAFSYVNISGSLALPSSLTTIGASAFEGTNISGTLTLPSGLVSIGADAFCGLDLRGTLILPQSLISIGDGALSGTNFESVDLRAFEGTLGNAVFWGCGSLTTLSFGADPAQTYKRNNFSGMSHTGTLYYPADAAGYIPSEFAEGQLVNWVFTPYASETRTFSVSQQGGASTTANSTALVITFNETVDNLKAVHVRVQNDTGEIITGALSGSGTTWTLALSSVLKEGDVTVSIANYDAYTISTEPQTVAVYRETVAPGKPQDLALSFSSKTAVLSWEAPQDDGGSTIIKYEVSKDGGTSWSDAGGATEHIFSGLTNNTTYTFAVRAVNIKGEGSSAALSGKPLGPPDEPLDFVVVPSDSRLALSWKAPVNNGGSPLIKYQYSVSTGDDDWKDIPSFLTNIGVSFLQNGSEYSVKLRAVNALGAGSEVSVTATPFSVPYMPILLTATPENGQVALAWQTPNNNGSALTSYEVSVSSSSVDNWEAIPFSGPLTTTHTVTSLTNDTEYTIKIRARNAAGPGAEALITATPSAAVVAPSAPRDLSASPGDGQVELSWQPPANNGGAAIARYEVSKDDGASWVDAESATGYTFTGLVNGTLYDFAVRAVNSAGEGAEANTTAIPSLVPDAPQKLTTTPSDTSIVLVWSAPLSNGGSPITHYEVSKDGTNWTRASGSLNHTFGDLINGVNYTLRVRAVNAAGTGAEASVISKPLSSPMVPGAPRNLVVTPGDGKLGLSWDPPATNNGSEVTKYQYSISTGSDDWKDIPFAAITSIGVSNLTNGTTYTVKVRAVNEKGPGLSTNTTGTPSSETSAPAMPENLGVAPTASSGELLVSWTKPSDGGSVITSYQVSVTTDGSESWEDITSSTESTESHLITGLTNDTSYTVMIRAVNSIGAGAAAVGFGTPVAAVTTPDAPVSLAVTPGDCTLQLHWMTPSNGGSVITKYQVSVTSDGATNWEDIPFSDASTTSHTYTEGLENDTEYTVMLRAVNDEGAGSAASVTATPHVPPPLLTFIDSDSYDIPASTVGIALATIDVSGGVSGGTRPYTFTAHDLPAGILISTSGVISGTPTAATDAGSATITVTDAVGDSASITIDYDSVSARATAVSYAAVQNGGASGTADSTGLLITFNEAVSGLTADDITVTGATKGELTGTGATWTIGISALTVADGEALSIAIANFATFAVSPADAQSVVVYKKLSKEESPTTAVLRGDSMRLTGVASDMKYSVDGGASYTVCSGTSVSLSTLEVNTAQGIRVVKQGDGITTLDSDPQIITLTQIVTPVGIGKTDETAPDANDGTLTGVLPGMEYRLSGSGSWTEVSDTTVSGLAPGTYEVRARGGLNVLPSYAVYVTIVAYGEQAPELVSITQAAAITDLLNGTEKTAAALGLPSVLLITISDEASGSTSSGSASVAWDVAACSYDSAVTEGQIFTVTGVVTLPAGVKNSNNISLATEVSVSVQAEAPPAVTGVSLASPPLKTSYQTGDLLELEGLSVKLDYNDGSDEVIAFAQFDEKGVTTSPLDGTTLASTALGVQIAVAGFSITQPIVVTDPPVVNYTATLEVNKDGALWSDHSKTFTLKLNQDESVVHALTGAGASLTASVPNGVWKVYEGTTDTGLTITISDANATASAQYYTVVYSVSDAGDALGSTITASYDGQTLTSGSVVMGGKTLVLTASGQGATTYTYAWGGTASGTTDTYSSTVSARVDASCTITGTKGDDPTHTYRTLQHESTGVIVKVMAAADTRLAVTQNALHAEGSCVACDTIRQSGNALAIYDISLEGSYSGAIEVSIPVPSTYTGKSVLVRHCQGNRVEEVVLTVQNGYATGIFNSLSPFAVFATGDTGADGKEPIPRTGDQSKALLVLSLLLSTVLVVGIAGSRYTTRHPRRKA